MEAGLIVHLGTHVATVVEERPPLGVLNAGDMVAHQLEGMPEIIPLGELLKRRGQPRFDLLRVPHAAPTANIVIGGDVMLGRSVGARVESGDEPFKGIRTILESASLRLINLECVISDNGAAADKPYCFRAPEASVKTLRAAGIDGVSLANNHAADFGSEGVLDCISRLKAENVVPIGAGASLEAAAEPALFPLRGGKTVAVLAISDIDGAGPLRPSVTAIMPASDRIRVEQAIVRARRQADFVVCLVHWGEENTEHTTEEQRALARWLVDAGVDIVVGSHPHRIQPLDFTTVIRLPIR